MSEEKQTDQGMDQRDLEIVTRDARPEDPFRSEPSNPRTAPEIGAGASENEPTSPGEEADPPAGTADAAPLIEPLAEREQPVPPDRSEDLPVPEPAAAPTSPPEERAERVADAVAPSDPPADTETQPAAPADEDEEAGEQLTAQEEAEMNQLIDSSVPSYEVGEIITGKVLKVTSDDVVVDVGSKSEGIIPLKEFLQDHKDPNVYIGKAVDVMVVQRENQDGLPVLSRLRAKERLSKAKARKAFESGEAVECVVQEILKGGFQVDVDGLRGFIPFSQMGPSSRTPEQQQALIGQTIKAKIIEMRGKRDLILSQRAHLEEERTRLREETLSTIAEGRWVKGRVKNLTDFGAFIDLGGIDGLLHVNDMSWGHVGHPREVVQVGQEIDVIVLKMDGERISLGIKQTKTDPWLTVSNHYPPGCRVSGKVTSLAKYGAFVELEEGVEGLVHISEISWTRRLRHPSEELKVGEEVRVQVLSIDEERRRISLSIRQATTDPWSLAKANYPVGSIIEGQVTGLTDFGAFVRLPEGVDGMIHVSDLSWVEKIQHPKQLLKKGSMVTCKVLDIDPDQQRISLGLKQMEPDPWDVARERYRVGDIVEVVIVKITDFGAFVELESGVEGLAHASTLPKGDEAPQVGDRVRMKVTKFDRHNRKISLSMKDYQRDQERRDVQEYMSGPTGSLSSLGEIINEALLSRRAAAEAEESDRSEETPAEETVSEEPPTGKTPIEEPAGEELATEEKPVEETADEEPATEEKPVEEPVGEEPATEEKPVEEPAGEGPSTEETPIEEPALEETTSEVPPSEEPPSEAGEEPSKPADPE